MSKDPAYRLESNRPDFGKIMVEIAKEVNKPHSPLLAELERKGQNSARASAQLHSARVEHRSAFGAGNQSTLVQSLGATSAMTAAKENALATSVAVRGEIPQRELALVPVDTLQAQKRDLQLQVYTVAQGGTVNDEVDLLRKLRSANVHHTIELATKNLAELRMVMHQPCIAIRDIQVHALARELTPSIQLGYNPWCQTVVPLTHPRQQVSQCAAEIAKRIFKRHGRTTLDSVNKSFERGNQLTKEPHLAPLGDA